MAASTTSQKRLPAALPCLVFDYGADDAERRPTTLYSVADGVHRPCEIEELRDKRSWVTSHGWVLTWDPATLATFLWNPHAAGRKIVLPSFGQTPPPPPAYSFCALSGKPTDDGGGFTVVMVEPPDSCFMWYCHVGSSSSAAWTRHEYDIGTREIDMEGRRRRMKRSIHCFTACGSKFYYFIRANLYGVLELSPEPVFSTVRMKPVSPFSTAKHMVTASIFSLDVNGDLHLVFIFKGDDCNSAVDVAVYRVDIEKRKHTRIGSIGDRAILVGGRRNDMAAGWCRASRHGLLPNSIYWMNPWDCRLRVYELGKRTEEVRDPFKGVAESADGSWCQPYWMIPAHH